MKEDISGVGGGSNPLTPSLSAPLNSYNKHLSLNAVITIFRESRVNYKILFDS